MYCNAKLDLPFTSSFSWMILGDVDKGSSLAGTTFYAMIRYVVLSLICSL